MASVRPNPIQWLWYSLGGRLPEELAPWILRDATSPAWRWRLAARSSVLVLPLASIWLLLPGPLALRLALALMALLVGYFYSQAYGDESIELRVAKHGYEYGTARALREAAQQETDADARARYNARYRT